MKYSRPARSGIFVRNHTALLAEEDSTVELSSFDRLFVVTHADGHFHGEEPFYVFEFADASWLVPETTPGLFDLIAALRPTLEKNGVYEAKSPAIPLSWRKRLGGILPLFPLPRLTKISRDSYPSWQVHGPVPFSKYAVELGGR